MRRPSCAYAAHLNTRPARHIETIPCDFSSGRHCIYSQMIRNRFEPLPSKACDQSKLKPHANETILTKIWQISVLCTLSGERVFNRSLVFSTPPVQYIQAFDSTSDHNKRTTRIHERIERQRRRGNRARQRAFACVRDDGDGDGDDDDADDDQMQRCMRTPTSCAYATHDSVEMNLTMK